MLQWTGFNFCGHLILKRSQIVCNLKAPVRKGYIRFLNKISSC